MTRAEAQKNKGDFSMPAEAMWAALNMEMPPVVPRTEYSAASHWPLIEKVTGIRVDQNSTEEERLRASSAFMRAWHYAMWWNTDVFKEIFNGQCTDMGHAMYNADGSDYSDHITQLFDDPEDVYGYDLFDVHGTPDVSAIERMFDEKLAWQQSVYPEECLCMNGIYVTCISGVLELLGWETLLLAAGIDPDAFGAFIDRYCRWIGCYFEALARCKSPVVMVHDDFVWGNGGFLAPAFYRRYVFPNYRRLFAPLIEAGKKILFTADGDYTEYIDDVAACGVHGFVMEPATDMRYIAEKYGRTHVFVGNADTAVLYRGTKEDIFSEVKRCMDIGKGCPGFVMAVGNHIPANTPVDNALWYNECYEKMARR